MTGLKEITPTRRTRVLFLAWGYSVHARRRIEIFAEDPQFDVAVVSTFAYQFENAKNVLLLSVKGTERPSEVPGSPVHKRSEKTRWQILRATMRSGGVLFLKRQIINCLSVPFLGAVLGKLLLIIRKGLKLCLMMQDLQLLQSVVGEFRPDVVFLQTLLYPAYLAYFLPRSIPIIITFWNGDVIWWAKWNGIERLLKKQIVTYGVKRASLITVNSQKAFDACLEYGTEMEKIKIVRYPGVDLDRFKPIPKDEARRRIGIRWQKVVFCPRGIGGFLNSETIVEAARVVIESFPETLFIFAGVMVERDLIEHRKRTQKLGIEDHFIWKGMIRWEEMPNYYCSSDVMVSISSNDSLPNCMLEAMACGIPVIMGDIPQLHEWIEDGVKGFLVPTDDAALLAARVVEVFERRGSVDRFGERNQRMVERELDSQKNKEVIKNLVHQFSGTGYPNESLLHSK